MTPEERDIIARFVQRVAGSPASGSVPSTTTTQLAPVDPEADQHLANLFQQYPDARYRMTQFAFGQEQALQGAAQHIQALEQQLAAARQGPGQFQPQQGQGQQQGGFFSRLFGGPQQQSEGQAPYARPYQQNPGYAQQQPGFGAPPPGYSPGYGYGQQGMAQRGGSGFLGSALTTAAGVAGGMLAFNAIEGLFSNRGAEQIGAGDLRHRSGGRRRPERLGGCAARSGRGGSERLGCRQRRQQRLADPSRSVRHRQYRLARRSGTG